MWAKLGCCKPIQRSKTDEAQAHLKIVKQWIMRSALSSHVHNLCRTCASWGFNRMHLPVNPTTVTNLGDCYSCVLKHRDYPKQLSLPSVNACEQLLFFFLHFFPFSFSSFFPSFFPISFWKVYLKWWTALTTLTVERATGRTAPSLCKVAFHPSRVLDCKAVFLKGKVACQLTLIFLYIMHATK